MRPSRLAFFACVLVALGQTGCCHWWHPRHCCYPPATGGPAATSPPLPLQPVGPPGALTGEPVSLSQDGTR